MIWKFDNGEWEAICMIEGHKNEVKHVAWSPNGKFLATCNYVYFFFVSLQLTTCTSHSFQKKNNRIQ